MNLQDFVLSRRGINPDAKRSYVRLFNSKDISDSAQRVLDDLMMRFRYYGAQPTNDPIVLAKQAAYREVIEYILTMSARISKDTLLEIEKFINRGGNNDD